MSRAESTEAHELTCWDCQAPNDADASECWLCQRRDWRADSRAVATEAFGEIDKSSLGLVALAVVALGLVFLAPGLVIPLFLLVPAWGIHEWRACRRSGPDLRFLAALKDAREIPLAGTNMFVVAAVKDVLHFRVFDNDGNMVVDTDETKLAKHARPIDYLKNQLATRWPSRRMTENGKLRVIAAVSSIVGYTAQYDPASPERMFARILGTMALLFMLLLLAVMICLGQIS